jgi:hypothetical protein
MFFLKFKRLMIFFTLILLLFSVISCQKQEFTYTTNVYIQDWLLCGPFPNCEDCSLMDYKHSEKCRGFYTDYLTSIGGEQNALPEAGMIIAIPEKNEERQWFYYQSESDLIPLNDIFSPNDMVIAYAFCNVISPEAQKTILSVGSNDGIQIFLNGQKIHENHPRNGRWLQKDNDYVPVALKAGPNRLLIKVDEGGGDFGFVARFLNYDSTLVGIRKNIENHKILSIVSFEDTLVAQFGQPYKISTLNPKAEAKIEIIHEKTGKITEQSAPPGTELKFPVAEIPDGFYIARATFETPDDGTIISETRNFKGKLRRHPPAGMLNKDLVPVLGDGTPIFPIGTYGAPPEDYLLLKAAGYNFVVASSKNLDNVHEAGLKAAVPIHGAKPHWFSAVRDSITKYKKHPAVLCWMLYDEPGYNRADLLDIYKIYNIAYEADPYHPAYLVITNPAVYKTFGRCCDVLAVDTYPIAQGDITAVGGNIAKAYRESEDNLPVWHCGQLFKWPAQRRPTPQEHRFMTYITLIEGAKGMLWYTYKGYGQYLPTDDPALWAYQKTLLKELNELAPLYIEGKANKNIALTEENPEIKMVLKKSRIGTFLMAANQSKTDTFSPEFKLNPKISGQISVYGENKNITITNGRFTDQFKPLDVHIYKIP